ncbi:MAG: DUF554 domain-containing protein [Ruminococcaceae bacterium]|nr:DUF554 domain-containing protein [Oscillospiraceae bacterium]
MRGLGTIINVAAVLAGSSLGLLFRRGMKPRFKETLMQAMGVSVVFLGLAGALSGLLEVLEDGSVGSTRSMVLILSMLLGSLAGEFLDLEGLLERFGLWLRKRADAGGDDSFINGFLTASLTICVGAMAVVGSIQDGLTGDYSMLAAKALLDMIIVLVYASTLGKGVIFSAIPVGIFQGAMTALAGLIAPLLTDAAVLGISFVGSVLVFCVGANLAFDRKFHVANMLPALLVAAVAMSFA